MTGTCESSSTNEHMDGPMVCWLDAGHEGPHIDRDPVWGGQWEDATPTYSPAVERAAELLIREAESTGLITADVRNGLAAALDVEEMARAADPNAFRQFDPAAHASIQRSFMARRGTALEHARKIRAAILGGAS